MRKVVRKVGKLRAALRLVAFYVSDPNTPFLDPIH
jgi:hypothetical protein